MTQKVRKAVFPVAGLGTRFLPATKAMPKEMLTVVDKPIIQYAVEEALAAGIEEIIFVTGRGKGALENHFDHPYELAEALKRKGKEKELEMVTNILPEQVRVIYTRQGEPHGLGHAIWCAKSIIGDEPFAVLLPDDIIYSENTPALKKMVDLYEKTHSSIVMVQRLPEDQIRKYGILDIRDEKEDAQGNIRAHGFVEKPNAEDAPSNMGVVGRYIFTPRIMDLLDDSVSAFFNAGNAGVGGEVQLTDAMDRILAEESFYGHILNGRRFDCGDKVGFQEANIFFSLQNDYIGPRLLKYLETLQNEGIAEQIAKRAVS